MKKNKRAFTLVELLATIVVITIILVIAIPQINDVIYNSKKDAFRNNVLNLFDSVTKLQANENFKLDEQGINYNDKRLKISNNPFIGGKIIRDENGQAYSDKITDGTFCAIGNKKTFTIADGDCDLKLVLKNISFSQEPAKQKWYLGKTVKINISSFETLKESYQFSFSVDGGKSFHKIDKEATSLKFGIDENGVHAKDFYRDEYGQIFDNNLDKAKIIVRATQGNENTDIDYQVTMVDSTAPTAATLSLSQRSTNTMYIVAGATEKESYIKRYEFKIDDGQFIDNGNNPLYKLTNLTQGEHKITVRIFNAVDNGEHSYVEIEKSFLPATLFPPTITVSPTGNIWAKEKIVSIKFPMDKNSSSLTNNYEYYYKYITANSQQEFLRVKDDICTDSENIEIDNLGNKYCIFKTKLTSSGTMVAKVKAAQNEASSTADITNIDSIAPTISASYYATTKEVRLYLIADDEGGSGIAKYECQNNGASWTDADDKTCIFNNLSANTSYNFEAKVIDNAGNYKIVKYDLTTPESDSVINFIPKESTNGQKIQIIFPNLGTGAQYQYKIGNGEFITASELSVMTNEITTNGTVITARVLLNGELQTSKTYTVNLDSSAPTCSWTGPTGDIKNGYIKNGQSVNYTLTCIDDSEITNNEILANEIVSTNENVATVSSISAPTSVTKGYKYTVTVTAGASSGSAMFTLNQDAIIDGAGRGNEPTQSLATKVDNTAPTCSWAGPSGTMKNGYIKKNQTLTYIITCSDNVGFEDNGIVLSNITSSNENIARVTAVAPGTPTTTSKDWTITVKAGETTGNARFTLSQAVVSDIVGNTNASVVSAVTKVDNTPPTLNVNNSSGSSWVNGWANSVVISGTYSDSHSGINTSSLRYTYDQSSTGTNWSTLTATAYSGTWTAARDDYIYVRVADQLGNTTSWISGGRVRIEKAKITANEPVASNVSVNGNWYDYYYPFAITGATSGLDTANCYMRAVVSGCNKLYYGGTGTSCGTAKWTTTNWKFYRGSRSADIQACYATKAGRSVCVKRLD